ncbi:MAG: 5-(carboxyamino)imidazole ribonucleotide mutase [Chloroflexota bacterium]|jgi:5-(carboxyamino)imidazole ribonucleotide mutase|nr:5-(carboxyamino)imidazole ribonucleotide mutase [Chloroflexota bacterium]MQG19641.1 5-(carboxyamino)imidazole ribonucleotide mutase [SAR202 cluster bacterium]MEC7919717.1 5-(carboxyamino)imidazole ribonucleotide mutase [Chloroflexota bacterium]MEC9099056.1 5-(carboxyamino)imidazole ribonucleotide mutase [Chloroflexota bacterium]MED5237244.1 5-(carboxyamino)imidazole ribonucleotide mutase [Chloroflexota bacterium]|tara:strand:- start:5311 stop:5811 length:501 start_codon:yes stop_codon:yes gene_type:complete
MNNKPKVSIIMGSKSDLDTMSMASEVLRELEVSHEIKIISAHRTPDLMFEFAKNAQNRGIEIIIAGAGGAAHLPGMVAAITELPVIGVPIKSSNLNGIDSLLSIVQMPKGVPVATVAIGDHGAENAALISAKILALNDNKISKNLQKRISNTSNSVKKDSDIGNWP